MRRDTFLKRYEIFIAAACIASHASRESFRQRDVRFLVELFLNWVESSNRDFSSLLSNTHILRYLDDLVAEGYAKKSARKAHPEYRLTRIGILELLGIITDCSGKVDAERFFFCYHFISSYGDRLSQIIEKEGRAFPPALRSEINVLLDNKSLVRKELEAAQLELKRLEERMDDSERSGRLAKQLFQDGKSQAEVVKVLEERYPYELNSQKSLSELIGGLPQDLGTWELQTGNLKRVELMWKPMKAMLLSYIEQLKKLT
jgi:hypothetical protein